MTVPCFSLVFPSNTITMATGTSISVSNGLSWNVASNWVSMPVIVTEGTGVGQMRNVQAVSFNYNSDQSVASVTLTLDRPWTVAPGAGSHVFVGGTVSNSVFYQNSLSAQTGCKGSDGNLWSTTGFEIFTGGYGLIFDGNTTHHLKGGASVWSASVDNPTFFDEIINNDFQNSLQAGITVCGTYGGDLQDPNYIGVTARNNTVTGPTQLGIYLSEDAPCSGQEILTVIENNSVTATVGLCVRNASADVLVRKNTFTAAAPTSTSVGIQFISSPSPAILLRDNTYGTSE